MKNQNETVNCPKCNRKIGKAQELFYEALPNGLNDEFADVIIYCPFCKTAMRLGKGFFCTRGTRKGK